MKTLINLTLLALTGITLNNFQTSNCFAQVANGTGAGNCLSFNGTSNYVALPDDAFATLSTGTIEEWCFISSNKPGEQPTFTVQTKSGAGTPVMYLEVQSNGNVLMDISNGGPWQPRTEVGVGGAPIDQWIHVALTVDGSGSKIFINGVLKGTSANTMFIAGLGANMKVRIGTYHWNPDFYYAAPIDEVRIWNRALTQDEIRATMCKKLTGNETGLVGYWRFDEGSGSTVYDASSNGNNGTLH